MRSPASFVLLTAGGGHLVTGTSGLCSSAELCMHPSLQKHFPFSGVSLTWKTSSVPHSLLIFCRNFSSSMKEEPQGEGRLRSAQVLLFHEWVTADHCFSLCCRRTTDALNVSAETSNSSRSERLGDEVRSAAPDEGAATY